MRVGDYILTINNQEVQNMDKGQFDQCLRSSAKTAESRGNPLVLEVTSGDSYARSTTPDVTPPRSPSIPRRSPTPDIIPAPSTIIQPTPKPIVQ
jgi:hypothetical protein